METKNCLNCNEPVKGKFCQNCGQKKDTHRITLKHFVLHDLAHGVWHFDKGILFTLKQLFTRPGYAALDYINGKRIQYYNIFYFLLLVIGFNLVIFHYSHNSTESEVFKADGDGVSLVKFFSDNIKLLLISLIPFLALNSWLLFKKLKLNFVEHVIISGFAVLGSHLIFSVINLYNWATQHTESIFWNIILLILVLAMFFYPAVVYFQISKGLYKNSTKFWKIFVMYLLFILELIIALFILLLLVGNNKGFSGSIELN